MTSHLTVIQSYDRLPKSHIQSCFEVMAMPLGTFALMIDCRDTAASPHLFSSHPSPLGPRLWPYSAHAHQPLHNLLKISGPHVEEGKALHPDAIRLPP